MKRYPQCLKREMELYCDEFEEKPSYWDLKNFIAAKNIYALEYLLLEGTFKVTSKEVIDIPCFGKISPHNLYLKLLGMFKKDIMKEASKLIYTPKMNFIEKSIAAGFSEERAYSLAENIGSEISINYRDALKKLSLIQTYRFPIQETLDVWFRRTYSLKHFEKIIVDKRTEMTKKYSREKDSLKKV